ncbi:hypothetical protein N7532_003131 [Penicillium argentinense]|uniref:Xylanolytic transcriptional activator regulatory domain-containing protein n=1 Tax=Penicillium argentinense TaxID=1131581 RepID=A0A9W9KEY5_9EURO|nr:uncharacterized protein N7532_003131 [Penicillium argentinense]KAJ5102602.1 hypothetical protein N7532_003131 [Penicillium argentinense]
MRSSLSCTAPCQKCSKSRIPGCELSRPSNRTPRKATHRARHATPGQRITTEIESDAPSSSAASPARPGYNSQSVDRHLTSLSTDLVLKSLNVFVNKYPELAILHLPSFAKKHQSQDSKEIKTLLAALLAITRSHPLLITFPWESSLLPKERYAEYARERLSKSSFEAPRLEVAQALLIMTVYEWGTREFHRAWIYCGIATRIMQALNSSRIAPYPLDSTPSEREREREAVSFAIENRTTWACFILDRMVSSGTYNPPMLPWSEMEKLKVSRPLSAVEFAFGPDLVSQTNAMEHNLSTPQREQTALFDITQSFEVLVSGFDIWAQVMTFIYNDGRRAPGMCAPQNCPWAPESPWSKTRHHLQTWRANQHHRLYYPENSVLAHTTLGYGESFTYLNLLYSICTLMLHREYFPFMPTGVSAPRGPIDPPTLEAESPEGWWEASSFELFGAAENIARLLHDASECGAEIISPFVGFCAFSAAYMNLYVFRFPQMNLGRSQNAERNLNYCMTYLENFRQVWKLADSWIATIKNASLLYQRATADRSRYQGKSRADFDVLHQSIHEFRVVDRSDQHLQEIEGAEREAVPVPTPATNPGTDSLDLDMPLNNLLTEVSTYAHEQGMWSHWWGSLDDINLSVFQEPDNPE